MLCVDNWERIQHSSGHTLTGGYQSKLLSPDKLYVVKLQLIKGNTCYNDWLYEVLASKFMHLLGIEHISQKACEVSYKGREFMGCISSFVNKTFLSFNTLMQAAYGIMFSEVKEFTKLNIEQKFDWLCTELVCLCGVTKFETEQYFRDLALVDVLVGNIDRHSRNFGVWEKDGVVSPYPIFDCGYTAFVAEPDYPERVLYIEPYSEEPEVVIKSLGLTLKCSTNDIYKIIQDLTLSEEYLRYLEGILYLLC